MDELENEEEAMTVPFDRCPSCGGKLEKKTVEKLLRGGGNTAVVAVRAEVCTHCGERLYSQRTIRRFEGIRQKLERRQTRSFRKIGNAFEVVR